MEDAVDCLHHSLCFCLEHNQTTIRTVWTCPDDVAIFCWLAFQRFPADMRLVCISLLRLIWSSSGEKLRMALSQPLSYLNTISTISLFLLAYLTVLFFLYSLSAVFIIFLSTLGKQMGLIRFSRCLAHGNVCLPHTLKKDMNRTRKESGVPFIALCLFSPSLA